MAHPALLLAFSDHGATVTGDEFTDWYDNEHVPLRVDVPAFLSWTRWKAADGAQPTWAASYDIASYEDTLRPPYTTLAETRSEREARVLRDVGYMERRMYELIESPVLPPAAAFDENKRTRFVRFVSTDVKPSGEDVLNRWYDEEHILMLSKLPGWVRSRRFVLREWSRTGVEGQNDQQPVPRYLAVHEWESVDAVLDPEVRKSFLTPLRAELDTVLTVLHGRTFEYYRHWERK
ncbi:hypothetical protein PHLGIDRAFT_115734 [Phlebiopsis gigantea 11061_1 CR5-6]|uniref:EthD domain-containing protein n=1 Tax=Phlebiopsis gigantea (strain 11061_1 CR5-6) TaxID=745531 RepID=A0A0C3SBK1_PHLG1|nr:hypothetical protein PHLGIDRAFT_115734 [Phlebiopsis gigantea 11061_1 CR5-6]